MLNKNQDNMKENITQLKEKLAKREAEFNSEIEKLNSTINYLQQIEKENENRRLNLDSEFNEKITSLKCENKRLYESKFLSI